MPTVAGLVYAGVQPGINMVADVTGEGVEQWCVGPERMCQGRRHGATWRRLADHLRCRREPTRRIRNVSDRPRVAGSMRAALSMRSSAASTPSLRWRIVPTATPRTAAPTPLTWRGF